MKHKWSLPHFPWAGCRGEHHWVRKKAAAACVGRAWAISGSTGEKGKFEGFGKISPVSGELALNPCIEQERACLALRRRKRMTGRHGKLQWAKQKKRLKLCGNSLERKKISM